MRCALGPVLPAVIKVLLLTAIGPSAVLSAPAASAACSGCHAAIHEDWSGARHGKMLQPAAPASVLGNFTKGRLTLRGVAYRVRTLGGAYFITQAGLEGREREYRVDYTLGSRRIQHYLTTMKDGRMVILAPSWDVLRGEWFHNMEIVDGEEGKPAVEHASNAVQVWNKNCYSCHVSGERKNFDSTANKYATAWDDFGTGCARCHGPGERHIKRLKDDDIVVSTRLDSRRSTMVCAQCHSLRDIVAEGFQPGGEYLDHYLPILEYGQKMDADPAYWADGRPRRFSNDAIGFWQSACYLKGGAACASCHTDVHDPEVQKNQAVRDGSNHLCESCHRSITVNVERHSHHNKDNAGSQCVECHMPRTVFSIKAAIRDHSISVPAPSNTVRFGIPNACGSCHKDKSATWTTEKFLRWYDPSAGGQWERRAAAFTEAKAGQRGAIDPLLAILSDTREAPVIRANAAGHLNRFADDPRVLAALERSLRDPEPLVRAVAALRIESTSKQAEVVRVLLPTLGDAFRAVRVGAVWSLVNLGARRPGGAEGVLFDRAKAEYVARAEIQSDDGPEQQNLGIFQLLAGDPAMAIKALQTSLRLDSKLPAQYFLGCAYLGANRMAEGIRTLEAIPPGDRYFDAARQVLLRLPRTSHSQR